MVMMPLGGVMVLMPLGSDGPDATGRSDGPDTTGMRPSNARDWCIEFYMTTKTHNLEFKELSFINLHLFFSEIQPCLCLIGKF